VLGRKRCRFRADETEIRQKFEKGFTMKIHQLPHGARFEYEGAEYVKTGPLLATGDGGRQRLIPRYAVLKPLERAEGTPATTKPAALSSARVRSAFDEFYGDCKRLVPADGHMALAAARDRFLEALDTDGEAPPR
jgi:hypothetical protein